jgi:hypothetical protein
MPTRPQAEIVQILSSVAGLNRDGSTFWGDDLEEFEIEGPEVFCLRFMIHGSNFGCSLKIAAVFVALAEKMGTLTLMRACSDNRLEIVAGMNGEKILSFLG